MADFSVTDDVASSRENGMGTIGWPLRWNLNRVPGVHEIAISRPTSGLVRGRASATLAAVRVRMGYHAVGEARNSNRAQTDAVLGWPGYPGQTGLDGHGNRRHTVRRPAWSRGHRRSKPGKRPVLLDRNLWYRSPAGARYPGITSIWCRPARR